METCAGPSCGQPGTNKCSACKTTAYCGPVCQTAHWIQHKEQCSGHLKKVAITNLNKARKFSNEDNYPQQLRCSDIAVTKLKQLKDCPVEVLDAALSYKHDALNFLNRHKEAMECAKEWYCLHLTQHTHPPAINAAFALIESCGFNKEYFDAVLYARTTWETITLSPLHIPDIDLQRFIARGAYHLAKSLLRLAECGDMPVQEIKGTGEEAIMLARRALETTTQLDGLESENAANVILLLAQVLALFNDNDDDEIPRLFEQAKVIFARKQGCLSPNVAACEGSLGATYRNRATRSQTRVNIIANFERALPHYVEAARIYRAINHMDNSEQCLSHVMNIEEVLRTISATPAHV